MHSGQIGFWQATQRAVAGFLGCRAQKTIGSPDSATGGGVEVEEGVCAVTRNRD